MKKCSKCLEEKSIVDDFYKGRAVCKNCVRLYKQPYNKKHYTDNIEEIKLKRKSPARKFSEYKGNAHSRNRSFELTFDQFKSFWQKSCYYCKGTVETIGLDRIDSSVGYIITNVVSCCATCNEAKMDRSQQEFIEHCRKVAATFETSRNY